MRMRFELSRDATVFAGRARPFVEERIERTVLATVLSAALRGAISDGLFACAINQAGEVVAAALRTPPWPMVVSELEHVDADALIEVWLREDPELPGVNGLPSPARAVAGAWQRATGGSWEVHRREALHVLDEVRDPPRPATGHLREASAVERGMAIEWERAFGEEVGLPAGIDAERLVDARLAYNGVYVWYDSEPACLVANAPPVAGTVRLGPVYTPPEFRGRGYASSAVAARSRLAMGDGLRCALFTDLANPTSNKIYADVGYRRIADWEEIVFTGCPREGGQRPA